MIRAFCVLRSGGDYRPEHVLRLEEALRVYNPGWKLECLSDKVTARRVPLIYNWPGWWSKMELFRPDIAGDIFFMDLDSTIVGNLSAFLGRDRPVIMRDVYRPDGLQSSVMYLPEATRSEIWAKWIEDPARWMAEFAAGGDQAFLEICDVDWDVWQDVLPGRVASYKAEVRQRGLGPATRLVVFHGRPRPWEAGW